jgi:hypothetical protein
VLFSRSRADKGRQVTLILPILLLFVDLVSPATHLEEISYKQRKPDSFWENLVADLLHSTLMPAKDKTWEKTSKFHSPLLLPGPVCMSELCTHFPGWGRHQCTAVCDRIADVYSSKLALL